MSNRSTNQKETKGNQRLGLIKETLKTITLEESANQTNSILSDLKPFDANHGIKVFHLMTALSDRFRTMLEMASDDDVSKGEVFDSISTTLFLFDQLKENIPHEMFDLLETLLIRLESKKATV